MIARAGPLVRTLQRHAAEVPPGVIPASAAPNRPGAAGDRPVGRVEGVDKQIGFAIAEISRRAGADIDRHVPETDLSIAAGGPLIDRLD